MNNRVLDFSESAARLNIQGKLLVVSCDGQPPITVPLHDIAVVIASHPAISISHATIAGLAEHRAIFVACDARRHPISMMLPLNGHSTQAERFRYQGEAKQPVKKRLWQHVIRAKISAQAQLLEVRGVAKHKALTALVSEVRSGDPANVEAQAARKYWQSLVQSELLPEGFRRDRDGVWPNSFFNYGYAILRAITARAVCGAGLHPTFGLHHHNKYNPFALADDLMEPFRPIVDRAVLQLVEESEKGGNVSRLVRSKLIEALLEDFMIDGVTWSLFDLIQRTASNIAQVFENKIDPMKFKFPEVYYGRA